MTRLARSILTALQESEPARTVVTEVQDGIELSADPHLLKIVLENLLGNAWKFTAKQQAAIIRIGTQLQDGEPVVFVADNGAGFDMKFAHKLFGAFQRLHGATEFEGTGIGRGHGAAHPEPARRADLGGCERRQGRNFLIPPLHPATFRPGGPCLTGTPQHSLRVLMVEDSADDAELVVNTLTEGGLVVDCLRVETAEAMQNALASGNWDVVLSDYSLPRFGADEALAVLKTARLEFRSSSFRAA